MPLFSSSSPFDTDVEKATDEMATEENWALILDICDRAKQSSTTCKDCLRSIMKRLNHRVPHVAMQAVTLLNACVKNCGRSFLLEVASRDFVTECRALINDRLHPKVSQSLKLLIKSWAENDFKSDSALVLIPDFYNSLKSEGHTFVSDDIPKSKVVLSKDPNVVSSQEEEEDIAKAIALSLKDAEKPTGKVQSQTSSLYPAVLSGSSAQQQKNREPRKVRALYDFEAVEDNELTFKAGEVVGILDDSDVNWWKGVSWRGEGLFPANFVTSDLDSEPVVEKEPAEEVERAEPVVHQLLIDEEKIDKTLVMLQNADPTGESCPDPPELAILEEECKCMQPLIDQELEKIDRLHGRLTEINGRVMEALQMYHSLMCEQPSYSLPVASQPFSATMMLPQQQQPAAVAVAQPFATFPRSAANISFEQMLNTQPQLSLGQIPQGIAAQVGPQAASTTTLGISVPQNVAAAAATFTTAGYDPNQQAYQYLQTTSSFAAAAPQAQQLASMPPGGPQVPYDYASLPSFHPQPMFNSAVQRQPMM